MSSDGRRGLSPEGWAKYGTRIVSLSLDRAGRFCQLAVPLWPAPRRPGAGPKLSSGRVGRFEFSAVTAFKFGSGGPAKADPNYYPQDHRHGNLVDFWVARTDRDRAAGLARGLGNMSGRFRVRIKILVFFGSSDCFPLYFTTKY